MRSSHGDGGPIAPVLDEHGRQLNVDNKADISDLAGGMPSDEVNDRTGRPREGQISPGQPWPKFASIYSRLASDKDDPNGPMRERLKGGQAWNTSYPTSPNYIPPDAFEPMFADQSECIFGFFTDVTGEWWIVELVRSIRVESGIVQAVIEGEERPRVVADFGRDGDDEAKLYRAHFALYLAACKGFVFDKD